jgi:hypothetical protein
VWGDPATDVLYLTLRTDADGQRLSGANRYTQHFASGELLPAKYWRIGMYDIEGFFFNLPINATASTTWRSSFSPDADGGLTILIQKDSPGKDKEATWQVASRVTNAAGRRTGARGSRLGDRRRKRSMH